MPFIFAACSFQVPLFLQLGFSSVELAVADKCVYILSLMFGALACMAVVSGSFSGSGIVLTALRSIERRNDGR